MSLPIDTFNKACELTSDYEQALKERDEAEAKFKEAVAKVEKIAVACDQACETLKQESGRSDTFVISQSVFRIQRGLQLGTSKYQVIVPVNYFKLEIPSV